MDLNQKLTFALKSSRNVAGPSADDLPEHRITLRAEDSHPALRVTEINFYLNFDRFLINLIQI